MPKATNKMHAILMGDLVHSRQGTKSEKVKNTVFNAVLKRVAQTFKPQVLSPLTVTLGDEFQGVISTLVSAFNIAQASSIQLLDEGIACRYVIAWGKIDSPINHTRASNMVGPGLSSAREKLNREKNSHNRYRFLVPDIKTIQTLEALGSVLTHIEDGWSDRQREVIQTAMSYKKSNAELAKKLAIKERVLYKLLHSSKQQLYLTCTHAIQSLLEDYT